MIRLGSLIRLYPRWWRERYGPEFEALVRDLHTAGGHGRWRHAIDIIDGAIDAHLHPPARPHRRSNRAAIRRGVLVGLGTSFVLAVVIGLSNVVFPTREDNDGPAVLTAYLSILVVLLFVGISTAPRAASSRGPALAGAAAGAVIAVMMIGHSSWWTTCFWTRSASNKPRSTGLPTVICPPCGFMSTPHWPSGLRRLPPSSPPAELVSARSTGTWLPGGGRWKRDDRPVDDAVLRAAGRRFGSALAVMRRLDWGCGRGKGGIAKVSGRTAA